MFVVGIPDDAGRQSAGGRYGADPGSGVPQMRTLPYIFVKPRTISATRPLDQKIEYPPSTTMESPVWKPPVPDAR
jgi:hypothetical protein